MIRRGDGRRRWNALDKGPDERRACGRLHVAGQVAQALGAVGWQGGLVVEGAGAVHARGWEGKQRIGSAVECC